MCLGFQAEVSKGEPSPKFQVQPAMFPIIGFWELFVNKTESSRQALPAAKADIGASNTFTAVIWAFEHPFAVVTTNVTLNVPAAA